MIMDMTATLKFGAISFCWNRKYGMCTINVTISELIQKPTVSDSIIIVNNFLLCFLSIKGLYGDNGILPARLVIGKGNLYWRSIVVSCLVFEIYSS